MQIYKITKDGLSLYLQDEDSCIQMESCFGFLEREMRRIDKFHDRSLFFQNYAIIDKWLELVDVIGNNELWIPSQEDIEMMQRANTRLMYLCIQSHFISSYQILYEKYNRQLKDLLREHKVWKKERCVSYDVIHTLSANNYGQDLEIGNISKYLIELNENAIMARSALYDVLSELQRVLVAVMDRGKSIVLSHRPTYGELTDAFYKDLKGDTRTFGERILREMKEDLNKHYKVNRTDPYTPELWGEMLNADEDALIMASKGELLKCNDVKHEHWGEDMKAKMTENGELMGLIVSMCSTDELFDFAKAESEHKFISMLTVDTIELFYDIILRRNLIQCEMNPELKAQHDKWLNSSEADKAEEVEEKGLNKARQSKLDEMIKILKNGNWKQPATAENIELLLNAVFGRDASSIDDGDVPLCEKMWALVEGGSGERMLIVPANLAGFFSEENLLAGSPKEISIDLFGNGTHINNINKGNSNRCSKAFSEVIPFLRKYIERLIRKVQF